MTTLRKLGSIYVALIQNKLKTSTFLSKHGKFLKLFSIGLCVANNESIKRIEFQATKSLTHEYLIQQASSVAVNAASQLLTQTVVAILDTAEEYKKALLDLMSLLQDSKVHLGNNEVQQELSDLIIASRSKANDFKSQLIEFETLLNYVEKVVISTAETSYLAGAEFVSSSLSERLYSAKAQVDEVMKNIKLLENEFLTLQKDVIIDTCEHNKRTSG